MEYRSGSEAETAQIAAQLAPMLVRGDQVGLIGQLGAGKTFLARHLICAMGGMVDAVSPSYVLCMEYPLPRGRVIEHWDLYRVKALPEDLIEPPATGCIRLIEWADKFPDFAATLDFKVEIKATKERRGRIIVVSGMVST